ncbi:acetyltransferase [Cupriavidus sp. AU9028]|uniref:acetyltransferase n=1 Tax=Cupriavidus sp. AU9028 TaxID=2871157 RepID=UPI001C978BE8|nr:acetyltransferase [Cupriavidus sp. AU9028]MBY4899206.1 acetyltransferase [Cupriavidus sp. AU9028]
MIRLRPSTAEDLDALVEVWRAAVLATHDFLAPEHFAEIHRLVATEYLPHATVWVAPDGEDRPLGFMGMTGRNIDSLFIAPQARGQGIGRALVDHAGRDGGALTVDVNEQNAQAVGFYLRLGFVRIGRSATDGDGRPYPLLHLRRDSPG